MLKWQTPTDNNISKYCGLSINILFYWSIYFNMLTFCCGETLINCARTINLFSHRVQIFANTAICFAAKVNLEPIQICRHFCRQRRKPGALAKFGVGFLDHYLGIESHFVCVHGPYELHRKEKQIKCTALAVHENLLFFPMQFIWPVNTDKMRFNTYIYIF